MSRQGHDALIHTWSASELGAFYVRNRHVLVTYAQRLVGNRGKAEEIVQDALIKVILAAPELTGEEHAIAYIKKSIENLTIDYFRLEGRRPHFVVLDELTAEKEEQLQNRVDHSEVLSAAEDAAVIRQALSLLSPAERAALVMWELEGRSAREIADELGIKESSVRHTVSRARATMRRILSELIIDEKRGLTALDLLSTTYKRSENIVKKSSRAALSLMVLLFAYLGFSNLVDTPVIQPRSGSVLDSFDIDKSLLANGSFREKFSLGGTSISSKGSGTSLTDVAKSSRAIGSSTANAKASKIAFAGLDKSGVPVGFTITDSTGSLGSLYFSGKEILMTESGMFLPSIAKTSSGAANIFLNQSISQDSAGMNYEVLLAYGRSGYWVPAVTNVISTEIERLVSGNYLLTAVIQVKSEVETTIVIPAATNGRDLAVLPSRVLTRIVLNPSKTQILAQAVQVIERVAQT